jgi:hypothetical protein
MRDPLTKTSEQSSSEKLTCRAEFIFEAPSRDASHSRPIKVLSECMCDLRRPDWQSRWNDWNAGRNPYLNLFLCEAHARKLGLMK